MDGVARLGATFANLIPNDSVMYHNSPSIKGCLCTVERLMQAVKHRFFQMRVRYRHESTQLFREYTDN